jgi:hypothetical protein
MVMTEQFWKALATVVDHFMPDEEEHYEMLDEDERDAPHIVHDLRILQAELPQHWRLKSPGAAHSIEIVVREQFWETLSNVLAYYLRDEEDHCGLMEAGGEDTTSHIVHDLRTLQAGLEAHQAATV